MDKIRVYRHWDLLITEWQVAKAKTEIKQDWCMLEWEVTNHHHRLSNGTFCVALEEPTAQNDYYRWHITIPKRKKGKVTHEEHDVIELKPWKYDTWVQREYDPIEERRVID